MISRDQRGGGVQKCHVTRRPLLGSVENSTDQRGRVIEISNLEFLEGRATQTQGLSVHFVFGHHTITNVRHVGGRANREFIQAIAGMEDQRPNRAEPSMRFSHRPYESIGIDPHDLSASARGVGQRTEQVEDRRKTQGLPDRHRMFCRRVVVNGEAEGDTRLLQAPKLHRAIGIDIDPEGRENFRRASARAGSVSVLGHLDPGTRSDDRGRGRDIEDLGSSARSGGIQQLLARNSRLQPIDFLSHHTRGSHEFIDGRYPGRKQSQKRSHFRFVRGAGHDRFEGRTRLGFRKTPTIEEMPEIRRQITGVFRAGELRWCGIDVLRHAGNGIQRRRMKNHLGLRNTRPRAIEGAENSEPNERTDQDAGTIDAVNSTNDRCGFQCHIEISRTVRRFGSKTQFWQPGYSPLRALFRHTMSQTTTQQ